VLSAPKCDFSEYLFKAGTLPPTHRCRTFPLLLAQIGYGLFCGLWVCRRTNRRPCCLPMLYPTTSSWTTRPDGSGRWDNRMAAQLLPRGLVRPSSGVKNWFKRRTLASLQLCYEAVFMEESQEEKGCACWKWSCKNSPHFLIQVYGQKQMHCIRNMWEKLVMPRKGLN